MFKREKLSGTNFNDWFRSLKLVLRVEKKLFVIEQPLLAAPAADSEAQVLAQWNAVYDAYNEVACLILGNISVGLILNGLTSDFVGFVRNYNMHNMGKTIGELHALLIEYEKRLPKQAATLQVMAIQGGRIQKANKKSLNAKGKGKGKGKRKDKPIYIPKPKNPKPSAKEHPTKDDACHHCKESLKHSRYLRMKVENQLGKTIKALRSNRGGEYISQEFKDYLKACGIVQHLTPPYTPQHNGVSERRNHTLLDMIRSMMNLTTLSLFFWDYALETATRIINMVPTKKVDKTSYELWYVKAPNLSYLKIWGCEALVKRDTPDKLQQRVVVRYAEFLEKNIISQKVSGRAKELEEIQKIHHLLKTLAKFLSRLKVSNHLKRKFFPFVDLKSNKWVDAMNAKMQSMKDNQVWCLVGLPPNCKTVESKWLFMKKTNIDGIVHTYKARLVVKGYTQTYEVCYEITFSPVDDIRVIRILIAIAAFNDYEISQMDVKTAFLNGYLNEDIYMVQPEGFVDPNHPRKTEKAPTKVLLQCLLHKLNNIATSEAAMEAVWIRKFILGLGIVPTISEPIKMFCDNSAVLHFAKESGVQRGA
nr:hypothetical protein [Tanacetum cinerariifolium]